MDLFLHGGFSILFNVNFICHLLLIHRCRGLLLIKSHRDKHTKVNQHHGDEIIPITPWGYRELASIIWLLSPPIYTAMP